MAKEGSKQVNLPPMGDLETICTDKAQKSPVFILLYFNRIGSSAEKVLKKVGHCYCRIRKEQ